MNIHRYQPLSIFILMLSACTSMTSWLQDDVYVAPPAELIDFTPEFQSTLAWSINTGSGSDNYTNLATWLQNDRLISVDQKGGIGSWDTLSGGNIWKTDLDVSLASGAGGGEGLILVGSKEGDVFALDEETGTIIWQNTLTSEVLSPPKAAMDVAIVRTADGRTTGLSVSDGHILWSYQRKVPLLSLRGAGEAIVADDKVITGYANGKLVALSITDGSVIWEKSVAVPRGRTELDRLVDIDSAPVIKDGIIYVVAYHGRLAALSLDDGSILWYREMSSHSGLDVDVGNATYVTDDQGYVWAIQDGTGDALWRQTQLLRRNVTAPVIMGDYLIVGDYEGYVHWISRRDGHFSARVKVTNSAILSKPIVQENLVYVTSTNGEITALMVP